MEGCPCFALAKDELGPVYRAQPGQTICQCGPTQPDFAAIRLYTIRSLTSLNGAAPVQLVLDHLSVARGTRTIISDLSLTVAAGQAVLLTGVNGAGKTTLIRAIAGLLAPSGGRIALEGADFEGASDDRELAQHCHYVGHVNALKASLTVAENLAFWADYLADGQGPGKHSRTVLDGVLQQLNLEALADIPTAYLSAGQKRRVGLARILMAKRPIWLLDEPTVSLDTASVEIVARLVNEHVASGGLALIATHLPLALTAPRTLHLKPAREVEAA